MSRDSAPALLALHAIRLQGMSTAREAADRFGLDPDTTEEILLDQQAYGRVSWSEFAGTDGWSLTARGRQENERQLRAELDEYSGARTAVEAVHRDFEPLNARLQQVCTDWQLRPRPDRPMAINDHTDRGWDDRVVEELERLATALVPLTSRLSVELTRFDGYDSRFAAAQRRARTGDRSAVTGVGHDSCHAVWFELHEDLLATLGLTRG